jgi:hypothetical protein
MVFDDDVIHIGPWRHPNRIVSAPVIEVGRFSVFDERRPSSGLSGQVPPLRLPQGLLLSIVRAKIANAVIQLRVLNLPNVRNIGAADHPVRFVLREIGGRIKVYRSRRRHPADQYREQYNEI